MLMDPIELSLLLERLEFSQQKSSRLLGRVTVGSSVTVRNRNTNEKITVTLVPPELADPESQLISFISPLGSSLLGLRLGDVSKNGMSLPLTRKK
ncbi:GreA/GreB family elongation factor [Idiomarina sp. UBA4520]|jgi:transcription elongation factor GreA|uniref:GreA/GreB family elongation factor n=1 Tax=Idiomarina sp. UBA4520 TaxID=1946647 RepID=UPI000AD64510|nr:MULTISPECIES: GreA/GreB family elongation factor [unclassified Idiomarina]|tara:strand:- start:618 stop:902 length:285 start_codon:yes stop_codon:yes gene_type:complete